MLRWERRNDVSNYTLVDKSLIRSLDLFVVFTYPYTNSVSTSLAEWYKYEWVLKWIFKKEAGNYSFCDSIQESRPKLF